MQEIEITAENFEQEVLNSDRPVLLDFWADWCTHCIELAPTIEKIAAGNPQIKVGKVNVEEQPELARKLRVMGIPTLIAFRDGQAVNRAAGALPEEKILEML